MTNSVWFPWLLACDLKDSHEYNLCNNRYIDHK